MSQSATGTLRDDITGGRAAETVRFALDHTTYEITLNKRNAAALRKVIGAYIEAGRPAGTVVEIGTPITGRKRSTTRSSTARGRRTGTTSTGGTRDSRRRTSPASPSQADIRAWALEQGIVVSARGRISNTLRDQYLAAH